MQQQPTPNSDRPEAQPEIYPPGSTNPSERIWVATGTHGAQRIYVAKLGPLSVALLALLIGVLAVAALFVVLGAAVIMVATGAALALGAILSAVLRGRFRRFR